MGKIFNLKTVAYIFSILFSFLILFPLAYMASSAVKDDISVYEMPPKIIPESPKSISFLVDYSGQDLVGSHLFDQLKADCALMMFSTVYQFDKDSVGEIKFYGIKDGKPIFYSRAHRMELRLELDYGIYKRMSIQKSTIILNDKYKTAIEKIGYQFDENGLNISIPKLSEGALEDKLISHFHNENYQTEGTYLGSYITSDIKLMLENFKAYVTMPSYVYSDYPTINKYGFFAFFFNTLLGLVIALATQVRLCALTAYALSKLFSPRISQVLLLFFIATLMIPFISIFVPLLKMFNGLNIKEGYLAMFLVHLYPDAFFITIYKGFFDQLPQSLFDAAKIDGSPEWYTFSRICIPLSTPIISVVAMNTFVKEWGNFFWYFAVANNTPKYWTINLAIYEMSLNPVMKDNATMGIAVVMTIPVILLALIFSNKIKESIALSGIKE